MISSSNLYGGLSATELLKLFAANSSSASSASANAISPSSVSPSRTDTPASSGGDPITSIRAILAASQISHVSANGGWTFAETAEAAYVNQTSTGGLLPSADDIAKVRDLGALSTVTANSSINASTGEAGYASTDQTEFRGYTLYRSGSAVVISGGSSLGATATQAPSANSAADSNGAEAASSASSTDYFQLSASTELQSAHQSVAFDVSVAFSLAGLGPITPDSSGFRAHAFDAQHNYTDYFQLNSIVDGESNNATINIVGLDAQQARDLMTSFQSAAAAANVAQYAGDNYSRSLSTFYMAGMLTSGVSAT